MQIETMKQRLKTILRNMPREWAVLTTHRLDIYDESQAKSQFIERLHTLLKQDQLDPASLAALPTAFDYVRLGHQLSSIFEWAVATRNDVSFGQVITFASNTMPILAVLRTDTEHKRQTVPNKPTPKQTRQICPTRMRYFKQRPTENNPRSGR